MTDITCKLGDSCLLCTNRKTSQFRVHKNNECFYCRILF